MIFTVKSGRTNSALKTQSIINQLFKRSTVFVLSLEWIYLFAKKEMINATGNKIHKLKRPYFKEDCICFTIKNPCKYNLQGFLKINFYCIPAATKVKPIKVKTHWVIQSDTALK